jgi:hypothetical protein
MYKFSAETFSETLREIPKTKPQAKKRRSKGYKYLFNEMCMPVMNDYETEVYLDFDRFTMNDLNRVISDFYDLEFNRIDKVGKVSAMFEKCRPVTQKTAFL